MYSAVLMLALTAGSESVDFGRNRCNNSCTSYGCSGAVVNYGCCGTRSHHGCSSYVGCSSNYGCNNSCNRGGLFHRNRNGCNNGCNYGYSSCNYSCGGVIVVPATKDMPKGEPIPDPKKEKKTSAPATIVINLPAEARLTVDGAATTSTTEVRTLVTPNLEFGSNYVYTMRAEIVRDGQTVTRVQEVNVRGGETSVVRFDFSTSTVASR